MSNILVGVELKFQIVGLMLDRIEYSAGENALLREQLTGVRAELNCARAMIENLSITNAGLAIELQELRGGAREDVPPHDEA